MFYCFTAHANQPRLQQYTTLTVYVNFVFIASQHTLTWTTTVHYSYSIRELQVALPLCCIASQLHATAVLKYKLCFVCCYLCACCACVCASTCPWSGRGHEPRLGVGALRLLLPVLQRQRGRALQPAAGRALGARHGRLAAAGARGAAEDDGVRNPDGRVQV